MKHAEKAHPHIDLEIGGDTVPVVCNYRTIFNYEKSTGKPLASIFANQWEIASAVTIVELLHAAIKHIDKKYTKEWILDNLEQKVFQKFTNEIMPKLIQACYVAESDAEQEKKGEATE
jgi:hypothetical protein